MNYLIGLECGAEKDVEDQSDRSCEKWRRITMGQGEKKIPHVIKRRNTNWISHISCKKYILKDVIQGSIEGRIERTEWQGRSLKRLIDDCKKEEITGN